MKEIKTPEEIIAKANGYPTKHIENNRDSFIYIKIDECIKWIESYHAQFATTSEELEKSKEEFMKYGRILSLETESCFEDFSDDLDSLLAMRREETPRLREIENFIYWLKKLKLGRLPKMTTMRSLIQLYISKYDIE